MMDKQAKAATAWENPLIPNARLRQIYRSMVRARTLARTQPAARRGQRPVAGTLGLEACLVSTAVDLGPGDLVSDALAGGVVEFLRGATLASVLRPGKAEDSRRSRRSGTGVRGEARGEAECGTAGRLPGAAGGAERIWAALGAAAALKAATAQARAEAKAESATQGGTTARQAGVVVFYALPGELTAARWRKALTFAAEQELPVVFVVLPAARVRGGNASSAAKAGGVRALAQGCGVPGIAVDADDAVAIYRVAQESIGRARAGGGAALMECVPFAIEGAAAKRTAANDAVAGLERYLVQRGVATKAWMDREAKAFARRVAR
jgi:TPP-dependent pyruvate/acetoin dehydrogenase alpha subunit